MPIKAIIFDHGGVLSVSGSLKEFGDMYAPKFGVNPEVFNKLMIEIWMEARVNKVDSRIFWRDLAGLLGIKSMKLKKDFIEYSGFRHDIFGIVKKLKKRYKLGMLSNQIEDWFESVIEEHKLDGVFDAIVTSYGSRMAKPEIGIYYEVVRRLGVKPSECVFVDDLEINLPSAKRLGMKTILFKDAGQLKKELKLLGVKF